MALPILDGNQSATTLSTILSGGQHITAHTVVSLGTQAITDMRGAVSGSVVSISNLPSTQTIAGTVTANGLAVGSTVANVFPIGVDTQFSGVRTVTDLIGYRLPISLGDSSAVVSASLSDPLPAGTNRIGVVTIGNTVTISGVVTANAGSGFSDAVYGGMLTFVDNEGGWAVESLPPISGTVTANVSDVVGGGYSTFTDLFANETVAIRELPSISGTVTLGASTSQIGSVTASISNSVVTFYPMQGTSVSNTNFTSITSSTTLVSAVAGRQVLTVFNEGAGNLHISAGATATTISYQVRLSPGDYWECPNGQLSLAHTAVFATAGTARVTQVS